MGVFVTLAKKNVTFSEVYIGGVIDRPRSIWFVERLKEAGLAA
jgi:hypothetical protein